MWESGERCPNCDSTFPKYYNKSNCLDKFHEMKLLVLVKISDWMFQNRKDFLVNELKNRGVPIQKVYSNGPIIVLRGVLNYYYDIGFKNRIYEWYGSSNKVLYPFRGVTSDMKKESQKEKLDFTPPLRLIEFDE